LKLWGGRFKKETSKDVEKFTSSLPFDWVLFEEDIRGSVAWAKALSKAGVLTEDEKDKIVSGLEDIRDEINEGSFQFLPSDEDIHTAVERVLVERVGEAGRKLHAGRSRNEQIVTDLKLYLKKEIKQIAFLANRLAQNLVELSERNSSLPMPGYTHLQPAQPVLFSHYLLAYFWMIKRDFDRLVSCYKKLDVLPLGSGALAGATFSIDRGFLAKELGFARLSDNSLDAVADRDFALHFLNQVVILMIHLSRLAEDLVVFSSQEFSFIVLDDAYTTGSSLMPQKKNPDVLELIRGKTGRVIGDWVSLAVVLKGLPLTYNRDLQEDKEPVFNAVETVKSSLEVMSGVVASLQVNEEAMKKALKKSYVLATDVADYLVAKGVAFREAHEIVGKLVCYAAEEGKSFEDLTLAEWQQFSPHFNSDIRGTLDFNKSLEKRDVEGGTSPRQVQNELDNAKQVLARQKEWLSQ
jgi:argininosuccinate lyase